MIFNIILYIQIFFCHLEVSCKILYENVHNIINKSCGNGSLNKDKGDEIQEISHEI